MRLLSGLSSRTKAIACVAAAVAYALLLAWGKGVPRYDCITLVVLLVALFRALDDATPRHRTLALHAITQVLLGSFLVHLWTIGWEGRNAVFGGILPWSDSFDYYDDALRLLHGDRFTEFSSKRPLFGVVLAALLKGSGGSLRFALFACAVAGALAIATAAREVWQTHGWRSALVVYLVLLFFERRWTGFIQTEHVGLPLGAIGFTLIWRANACRSEQPSRARRLVLVGLLSMAMGLMARAGAFFVLPAIAVWATRALVRKGEGRPRYLASTFGAMFAGFLVHKVVLSVTGTGVTFSDYPGIFYGLMHGEDYTYLSQTHPSLGGLSVAERVPEAWRIVVAEASSRPSLVVLGFAKSFAGLFTSPFGMFGYVWTNPDDHVLESGDAVRAAMAEHGLLGPLVLWKRTLGLYSLLNAGAMGALGAALVLGAVASIVLLVRRRHDADLGLLRATTVGVLASAPFTPPWITSGQQVQTVTLAFVAVLPAAILLGRRHTSANERASRDRLVWAPVVFAGAVVASLALLRLFPALAPPCAGGPRLLRIYDDTMVVVAERRRMDMRHLAIEDLRSSLPFLEKHNPELTGSIEPFLRVGTRYVIGFDACDHRAKLVVDDAHAVGSEFDDERFHPLSTVPLASPRILRAQPTPVEP